MVAAGTGYMRSYIFDAIFAGIHICFSGFFAAYGKSYIGFAHNVLAVALIRVPGAWLLSNAYSDTLFPMGIASPCGSILSAVICVVAFTVLKFCGAASLAYLAWQALRAPAAVASEVPTGAPATPGPFVSRSLNFWQRPTDRFRCWSGSSRR